MLELTKLAFVDFRKCMHVSINSQPDTTSELAFKYPGGQFEHVWDYAQTEFGQFCVCGRLSFLACLGCDGGD